MAYTRADKLRLAVAYALFKLKIPDRKGRRLTEAERYAIADHVVAELRQHGDQWRLDDDVEMPPVRTSEQFPGAGSG